MDNNHQLTLGCIKNLNRSEQVCPLQIYLMNSRNTSYSIYTQSSVKVVQKQHFLILWITIKWLSDASTIGLTHCLVARVSQSECQTNVTDVLKWKCIMTYVHQMSVGE